MKVCTILDKRLATLAGVPDAITDLVVPLGTPNQAIAAILEGNPLSEGWIGALDVPGNMLISWSGTLAEELFGEDPRTWMQYGQKAFIEFCSSVAPALEKSERTLLFRPHARHVLSDTQSSLDFKRKHENGPFGLAVSPCDLLVPDMLDTLEDHLERILTFLAPQAHVVFIEDARPSECGEIMERVPLGDGILPQDLVKSLLHEHLPADMPIVVQASESSVALDWLGLDQ